MHENACWAARAAESAGMLWGSEGFFKMHEWLFARKGSFTSESELHAGIRALGYDPAGFVELMSSEETLERVRADCREGGRLGLLFTPLVYINGVELRGILAPDALRKTVEELARTNPPPGSPLDDNPPPALQKFLADWMDQKPYERTTDTSSWKLGPTGARIQVLVWGDYQDPFTTEIDETIRKFVTSRTDAQYTFRMYPFNSDCNPFLKDKRFEHSCRTARAAEAAGRLGGVDTFWKVHAWLMAHRSDYSDELLRASAPVFGLDPDALFAEMEKPTVASAIEEDIRAGKGDGLRFIPRIIINGRWLQRFSLEGENVVLRALEAAAAE
jgi:protein-disulfide isomerase